MAKKCTTGPVPKPTPSTGEFIRVWETAPSVAVAAAELGITPQRARLRASYIRRSGVALKMFKGCLPAQRKPSKVRSRSTRERTTGPPVKVRDEAAFAAVWNAAANPAEAAETLNLTVATVCSRAAYLRCRGVSLKKFRTGPRPKPPAPPKPQPARTPVREPRAVTFATVWNAAATVREAADKLNLTPRSATTTATAYRREGVALKKFEAGRSAVINAAAFAAVWNAATTVEEAAERLGAPANKIRGRFRQLRQRGIDLKPLPFASAQKSAQAVQDFVARWNAAESPIEVASALGRSRHAVHCRACRLRKQGYQLKVFPPGPTPNGG